MGYPIPRLNSTHKFQKNISFNETMSNLATRLVDFHQKKPYLSSLILIAFLVLLFQYSLVTAPALPKKLTAKPKPIPPPTAIEMKVALIMQRYNCKNSEIFKAIMQTFDPVLIATTVALESQFRINVVSPSGCRGLMQITPSKLADWRNPAKNIAVGAKYLEEQKLRFGSNDMAIAAYNAGPERVAQYGCVPPFKETQAQIRKTHSIMANAEARLNKNPAAAAKLALALNKPPSLKNTIASTNTKQSNPSE